MFPSGARFYEAIRPAWLGDSFGAARSHGSIYFGKERITYHLGRSAVMISLHWSWGSRNYVEPASS